MKLHIDDQPARSLHQIRTYCRAVKRKHGDLGLIVIDYLQLMQGEGDSRHEEIAGISRGLKVLAKELHVPVLALSQLSRKCEERNNRRPQMSDIRESGQIEQDADVIAFIYRDEVYNPQTQDKGIAEIIFGKLRNGQIGTSALAFNGEYSSFNNLFRAWEPAPPQQKETRTRGFA
jgi:replicative DNA helicase